MNYGQDIAFFVLLAQHSSLASAAQQMDLTPPSVSRRPPSSPHSSRPGCICNSDDRTEKGQGGVLDHSLHLAAARPDGRLSANPSHGRVAGPGTRPYQNLDRFRSGLKSIGRGAPALAHALEAVRPSSRLMIDRAGELNIDLGGGSVIYPGGARAAARRQVATYLQQPFRFFLTPSELKAGCVELNSQFRAMAERMASFPKAAAHAPFGGFVVVFGVGLGHHLKALAETLDFKTMIVVEPHDEMIVHSLHAFDWQGLLHSLEQDGRELRIVRGRDLFSQVIGIMRGPHYPLLDGSYFFFHYQMPELSALGQRLLVECKDLAMVAGWIEDQLLMLRNNSANFAQPGFHVQQARLASARNRPAIVVGAGPSLDRDLEQIRRLREDAIVISASSALRVLLENGIRPDIHCELENIAQLAGLAARISEQHGGLSDIALYCSPTIDPRVPPLFRRTTYYFRKDISATRFYAQGTEATTLAEPTAGNAAVYCALSLGFQEIYLFGMDFGAKDPGHHHSRHSIYYREADRDLLPNARPYALESRVAGNFGGQVLSDWILDWGRNSAANAIRSFPGRKVVNCSDGSFIPGTIPLSPEALSFAPAALGRRQDVDNAMDDLFHAPQGLAAPEGFLRLGQDFRDFLASCLAIVSTLEAKGASPQAAILPVCERIIARLGELKISSGAAYGSLIGHLQSIMSSAFHFASTLEPAAAEPGLAALRDELSNGLARLHPLIDSVFLPRHDP